MGGITNEISPDASLDGRSSERLTDSLRAPVLSACVSEQISDDCAFRIWGLPVGAVNSALREDAFLSSFRWIDNILYR
jgi:hypothetical protein